MQFKRWFGALALTVGAVSLATASQVDAGSQSFLGGNTVVVDVVVNGGPAAVSDVTVEVYDAGDGMKVADGTDPSPDQCLNPFVDPVVAAQACFVETGLDVGSYQLGAVLPAGYVVTGASCPGFEPQVEERLDPGVGEFTINGDVPVRCELVVTYVTREVTADLVVVNDDGGTADGSEFEIEVFDSGGALVDSKPDPAPNDPSQSAVFELPVGDYAFGYTGPEGYDVTADVTVIAIEAVIDDPSAAFSVQFAQTAAGVLTANDRPQQTPTTPETTAPPPTPAPTQPPPPPPTTISGNLPATGATDQTLPIALLAVGLLAFGGGAVLVTRRR